MKGGHTVLPKISYLTSDQESLECKKNYVKSPRVSTTLSELKTDIVLL